MGSDDGGVGDWGVGLEWRGLGSKDRIGGEGEWGVGKEGRENGELG